MRNCPRCGTAVGAEEAFCGGCGLQNPFYVDPDNIRSGLEIDEEARRRWEGTSDEARPWFGGGVIADLPRDPLARVPPWRREAGVLAWECAIVFAAVRLATGRAEPAVVVALALGGALFFGARIFFVLRDGGWLPGARELAKSSALRGALAPLTWPIGALTFPCALMAMAHEAIFVTAPFLFGRTALAVLALAVGGFVAVLASR